MTYMLTHGLMGVMPIEFYLDYVASIWHTSNGTENKVQDARVMLEEITIEVNDECRKLMIMLLTKLNVASF